MCGASQPLIQIRSTSKRNGLTLFVAGLGLFLLCAISLSMLPTQYQIAGMFFVAASLVAMLLGWFKLREPVHSLLISKQHIRYSTRFGSWQIDWHNVQRIDIPKSTNSHRNAEYDMLGIRLKDIEPLIESISPRLATNLLLNQRALLLEDSSCDSGACYSASLIEDDSYQLASGKVIKGVKAMLANRISKLRSMLGYDLYISASELDRSVADFAGLMRDCHQQLIQEQAG